MTRRIPAVLAAAALAALSTAACSSAQEDEAASQEGAYSAYDPRAATNADGGDGGDGGPAASWASEAPGIELDDKGFPKNKYVSGYSFSGCEYWPYAISASPYPDHIQWGCTSGSAEAQLCMAAGMRRLAVILSDPPPQLEQVKQKYGISSFFNWNNDYYGAPAGRSGSERIWLYNGRLIKWMSATNRDGTCKLPERADLVRFLDRCLQGTATQPGC